MNKQISARTITSLAVLIALNIVITRLLSITIAPVRIGFGFVPVALGSMLFGTPCGIIAAAIADFLGALLQGQGVWPGFVLSAALNGATYGLFLHKKPDDIKRIVLCVILQAILFDALLGAFWYYHYNGTPYLQALMLRGAEALVMIPIKIVVLKLLWRYIGIPLKKMNF